MDRFLLTRKTDSISDLDCEDASSHLPIDEENNNSRCFESAPISTQSFEISSGEGETRELNSVNNNSNEKQENEKSKSKQKRKPYTQKFSLHWLTEFKWAVPVEDKGMTVCTVCNNLKIFGGAFHLRRHANSTGHIHNVKKISNSPNITDSMKKMTIKDKANDAEIKIICFLCEHNLSLRLADSMPEVCKHIFDDSKLVKNLKMGRTKCTNIILKKFSPFVKKRIASELKTTKFSIIIDETTDVSTVKSLVIIVRLWGTNGVQDRFFDLIEIDNGTAETLFEALKSLLDLHKIPYQNIVGFGADNCNVMMGHITGVQMRLKEICPNLVAMGCGCHSAHLCSSAACLKLPRTVEQFTRDVFNYFSNSSNRQKELREFQIFAQETVHKILKLKITRWLSFNNVVNRLLEQWSPLTLYFQSAVLIDNLPTAKSIFEALQNPVYKLYFNFLSHALTPVVKLNLELQREKPQIPTLLKTACELYKSVLRCFIKSNILNSVEISKIQTDYPRNYKPLEEMYFGAKVDALIKSGASIDPQELNNFRLRALDYYVELSKQIKKRFDFTNPHLIYASKFSIDNSLSGKIESISEYLNYYPSINVDPELVNYEWQMLPEVFDIEKFKKADTIDFWYAVEKKRNAGGELMFKNLMQIVQYIMVFPHSSAAAERAFSQLNLIKTKIRNQLKISTIAALLHIKDGVRNRILSYTTVSAKEISAYLEEELENDEAAENDVNDLFQLLS